MSEARDELYGHILKFGFDEEELAELRDQPDLDITDLIRWLLKRCPLEEWDQGDIGPNQYIPSKAQHDGAGGWYFKLGRRFTKTPIVALDVSVGPPLEVYRTNEATTVEQRIAIEPDSQPDPFTKEGGRATRFRWFAFVPRR